MAKNSNTAAATRSFLVLIAPPSSLLEAWRAEYSAVVKHRLHDAPLLDKPLAIDSNSNVTFCASPSHRSALLSSSTPEDGAPALTLSDDEFYRLVITTRGAPYRLVQEAAARGIHSSRIFILPDLNRELLPELYQLFDLSLDTRIYGGHSTTADALAHGLPVLTVPGDHIASRLTASFLRGIEEQEQLALRQLQVPDNQREDEPDLSTLLITKSLIDYQRVLEQLLSRPALLQGVRYRLHLALQRIHAAGVAKDSAAVSNALRLQPADGALLASGSNWKAPPKLVSEYSTVPMLDFQRTARNVLRGSKAALEVRALQQVLHESFRPEDCPVPSLCGGDDGGGSKPVLPSPPHIIVGKDDEKE
jgi:Glycosyl transferase family 41